MKALATILMLLTLFLVGQPVCSASLMQQAQTESCCDQAETCCGDDADDASNDNHNDDCGGCNPFQNCSCCVAGVLMPMAPHIQAIAPLPAAGKERHHPPAHNLFGADPSGFWQPPRQS